MTLAFLLACGGGEDPDSGPPPGTDGGTGVDTGTPDGAAIDVGGDAGPQEDGAILNQGPVVSIAPVPDVTLPAGATLDGTVTDDGLPAGSSLTIGWVMFSGPGLVTFANPTAPDTTATFSVSGDYMLGLTANDGAVMSSATVVVHVLDPNLPSSVIGQIGPRSVEVGSTLTLDLEKASVSGEVVFGATPFPLPPNMSLVRTSGLFKFTPTLAQVGTIEVNFSAAHNSGTDREAVTITVVGPTPGAPTSISGRVLDANDAANGIITPLEGVTIRSLDQARSVTSGATGYFTLSGLPPGENYLEFDGSTVPGQRIAGYRARYNLPESVNTVIERPIYLMHIETAFEVPVIPSLTTVVNNTRIGVSLVIPPFTAKADDGSDFTGMVSISEVPAMFTPRRRSARPATRHGGDLAADGHHLHQPSAGDLPQPGQPAARHLDADLVAQPPDRSLLHRRDRVGLSRRQQRQLHVGWPAGGLLALHVAAAADHSTLTPGREPERVCPLSLQGPAQLGLAARRQLPHRTPLRLGIGPG